MLLASFVRGLSGEIGKLTRIPNAQYLDQALNAALAAREAIRQERRPETFYTHSGKPAKVSRGKNRNDYRDQWDNHTKESRSNTYAHNPKREGYYKSYRDTRDSREVRCYECAGKGHFASECPTRVRRTQTRNSPRRKHLSGRSSRSSSPRDESRREREKGVRKTFSSSGNE
jgi:hypothetical protein